MKAFVTGSTGLLGSNLVQRLLAQGHEVVALTRSLEKAQRLLGTSSQLRVVKGDIENNDSFAAELTGCDVLFHCAAYFREYYGGGSRENHWAKLEQINVLGTIDLLNRAERAGLKKVIYVSSSGVIGRTSDGRAGDESTPPDRATEENLYFASKVLAEQKVAEWLKTHELPVVLILPTWMYGPQDAGPTSAGNVVLTHLKRQLPAIPPGGSAVVDARDVAQAMINAVEHGRSGERYIVSNEYRTLASISSTLESVSGVPATRVRLSYPVALAVGWLSQTAASLQGKETLITVSAIKTMYQALDVSAAKARRELGFQPRSFEQTLRDTVNWYRTQQTQLVASSQ